MSRPEPPGYLETAEELSASLIANPDKWLFYLRNCDRYMLDLEGNIESLRNQKNLHEKAAQASISERNRIIRYQED